MVTSSNWRVLKLTGLTYSGKNYIKMFLGSSEQVYESNTLIQKVLQFPLFPSIRSLPSMPGTFVFLYCTVTSSIFLVYSLTYYILNLRFLTRTLAKVLAFHTVYLFWYWPCNQVSCRGVDGIWWMRRELVAFRCRNFRTDSIPGHNPIPWTEKFGRAIIWYLEEETMHIYS